MGDTLNIRPLDYSRSENWLVNESAADLSDKPCDLFYIYPTLTADETKPLMDMGDEKVSHKAIGFATAQIELFKNTRPFAPFVRQLEYHRSMEHLRGEKDHSDCLAVGMQDANRWVGNPIEKVGFHHGVVDHIFKNDPVTNLQFMVKRP